MLYNYISPALLLTLGLTLPAAAEPPRVVVDIAPLHGLVATVMNGVAVPDLIVSSGASPHDFALRPSQAAALAQADLVYLVSPALTPWLEKPLQTNAKSAQVRDMGALPDTVRLAFREGVSFEDDHDHDHASDHDDHEEAQDPHLWLDPQNANYWLGVIAADLGNLDPENAEQYRANAVQGQAELADLTMQINAQLTPLGDTPFLISHDALQYFEHRFGLSAIGAVSLSDAVAPGPARLSSLRDLAREAGITCVLSEPIENPELVQTVLNGLDVQVTPVDPLGAEIPVGPDHYTTLITEMAEAVTACLKGVDAPQ